MLHTAAKLHYEADLSQVEIAKRLGVSTATVSRLLQRARDEGIVRIEVRDLAAPAALGAALAERLALRRVAVIEAPAAGVLPALAAPAGAMLRAEGLASGAVLMIGWGRSVRAVIESGLPSLPGITVVPATGGLQQQAAHFQINEFTRLAAAQTGGTAHFLHAPYLPSSESRASLLADPAIKSTVALWDGIDAGIVGIGLPHALNSPEASIATPSEQSLVQAAGDVIRHYFDASGTLVAWDGDARLIAASASQLRAARLMIGVAAGATKAAAIIGAARARLISALVTDARTAEAVLDALENEPQV